MRSTTICVRYCLLSVLSHIDDDVKSLMKVAQREKKYTGKTALQLFNYQLQSVMFETINILYILGLY